MAKALRILTIENEKDNKILRSVSSNIDLKNIDKEFLEDLLYTAKHSKEQVGISAAGLAAPQVGKLIRAFYIFNNDTKKYQLFINPKIEILKNTQVVDKEGCLSVPNIEGNVSRFDNIKVTYFDIDGNKQKEKFFDWNAREILHENDHLDGVLFIDKIVE